MSKKYNIRICKCGRIHAIPNEKINKCLKDNKDFLLICAGCGAANIIGADIEPDIENPGKDIYVIYCSDFSPYDSRTITEDIFKGNDKEKPIGEILYDRGYMVPMKTGMSATDYYNGVFSDRWYPKFIEFDTKDATLEEIMQLIDSYKTDRKTVCMDRFIKQVPDSILRELSRYAIDGLDWKGTKYETGSNNK